MRSFFHQPRGAVLFLALVIIPLITGCRTAALKHSFSDYSGAYADTANEQLLLNLARRANGHPAYFMQLGAINSTFQFGGNVGGNIGGDNFGSGITSLAGTLGLSVQEQPNFTLTPLGGESFVRAVFKPVDQNIMFTLFNQGVPIDQLMRVFVQSVEFTHPDFKETIVFSNQPNTDDPDRYVRFLRLAGLARILQKHQLMRAVSSTNAADALRFEIEPGGDKIIDDFSAIAHFEKDFVVQNPPEIKSFEDAKKQSPNNAKSTAPQPAMLFQMRTFDSVLNALATEQQSFDYIAANNPDFLKRIPPSERRPILRFHSHTSTSTHTPSVATVHFQGKEYTIADPLIKTRGGLPTEESTWNREVFVMLAYIYSYISIDPSKLPTQSLINVN